MKNAIALFMLFGVLCTFAACSTPNVDNKSTISQIYEIEGGYRYKELSYTYYKGALWRITWEIDGVYYSLKAVNSEYVDTAKDYPINEDTFFANIEIIIPKWIQEIGIIKKCAFAV